MNTVAALKSENLWSNGLRRDIVKSTIAAAVKFDRKFASVMADHPLYFRSLPAIWKPVFYLIKDLDWFSLSFKPTDDVDRISFCTVAYDVDGFDFCPTQMEEKLGAMLPRKINEASLIISETGPQSTDFQFNQNPIAEVSKLSLDDAIECDFIGLVSDKVQKRNIFKWLVTLLQPEALLIIAMMYASNDADTCCETLKLPRIAANKAKQSKALDKCDKCRIRWNKYDFHPKQSMKLPENLLWDLLYYGLKTLYQTKGDHIPAFLNASVLNSNGFTSAIGTYTIVGGKGIHSVYKLDDDFYRVRSTRRAGITNAKLTCLLRLISTVTKINGDAVISPKTDFRPDALDWLDMFLFKNNLKAAALLESAAEKLALITRHLTRDNMDFSECVATFQKTYFKDFKFVHCLNCKDQSCPVNENLDGFIEKMGRLLQLQKNRTVALEDLLGYDAVEVFVRRNFDECDAEKVWKSSNPSIFKKDQGFPKKLLFDYSKN